MRRTFQGPFERDAELSQLPPQSGAAGRIFQRELLRLYRSDFEESSYIKQTLKRFQEFKNRYSCVLSMLLSMNLRKLLHSRPTIFLFCHGDTIKSTLFYEFDFKVNSMAISQKTWGRKNQLHGTRASDIKPDQLQEKRAPRSFSPKAAESVERNAADIPVQSGSVEFYRTNHPKGLYRRHRTAPRQVGGKGRVQQSRGRFDRSG